MTYDVIYLLSGKINEQAKHRGSEALKLFCETVMADTCHVIITPIRCTTENPNKNHGVGVVMVVPLWLGMSIMGQVNYMYEQGCGENLQTTLFDINLNLFYKESIRSVSGERRWEDDSVDNCYTSGRTGVWVLSI